MKYGRSIFWSPHRSDAISLRDARQVSIARDYGGTCCLRLVRVSGYLEKDAENLGERMISTYTAFSRSFPRVNIDCREIH